MTRRISETSRHRRTLGAFAGARPVGIGPRAGGRGDPAGPSSRFHPLAYSIFIGAPF